MDKTGKYIYDQQQKKVVKISDAPYVYGSNIWFPKSGTGYYDKSARRKFDSKEEKRIWMKEKNLVEVGEDRSNPWRGLAESRDLSKGKRFFNV